MWRTVFTVVLLFLFGFMEAPSDNPQQTPASTQSDAFKQYLPLIRKSSIVEVVETMRGEAFGYPTYYYVYGYVWNLISEPLYSVVLDLEVTFYPYLAPPYTSTIHITPALTATLPGQFNPFSYSLILGKGSASLGPILGASASTWTSGGVYYPLTIIDWIYDGTVISGTVLNDSDQQLENIRVVVIELEKCGWREATPDAQELPPGQEINFHLTYPSGCLGDNLVIVGQGKVQP